MANFCPQCGTLVFWELEVRPKHMGIAVGCFAEPQFPGPVRAVGGKQPPLGDVSDEMPVFEKAAT